MIRLRPLTPRGHWLGGLLPTLIALSLAGCGNGSSLDSSEAPLPPSDSTPAPPDSTEPPLPPDTTTPPPPDTTTPPPPPPPDTTGGPPRAECEFPQGSSPTPTHAGIAMGPTHVPPERFGGPYTGTQITATNASCLMADLEMARRANARVFISFVGNEQYNRDENGFSFEKWKARVNRFTHLNLDPYIEDGTILGHMIMDEPNDPHNWSGKPVTLAEIQEISRYSKEMWPNMATYIRAWPDYLKGGEFPHLDALWFHYLDRWGDIDLFLEKHMGDLQGLGLKIIGGLNVLNGGSKSSGIPGKSEGKNAMSAAEIRTWSAKFLAYPNLCAFLLWEWHDEYLARPDIRAAVDELAERVRNYPKQSCNR